MEQLVGVAIPYQHLVHLVVILIFPALHTGSCQLVRGGDVGVSALFDALGVNKGVSYHPRNCCVVDLSLSKDGLLGLGLVGSCLSC